MPLIGEELRTILGMMPVRDRAGIARGTMADEAMKSSANAEGQTLMQQGMDGARPPMPGPPQIKLPPMGGPGAPPPPADVTLPPDVPAEYASGRGGGQQPSAPVPTERVVAASPAAAPSQRVATQASDVMMAALEQRERQQKMMQLVGSIGLIANAFNRNPTSQASTKASLADMVSGGGAHGGGGGISIGDIKTIADMKAKENQVVAEAAAKENAVKQGMLAHGLTRERATYLYDTKALEDRDKPAEMRAAEDIRNKERQKARLRPMAGKLAALTGGDEAVIRNRIESDPDAVEKLVGPDTLLDLEGKRTTQEGQRATTAHTIETTTGAAIKNTKDLADLQSAYWFQKDPHSFIKAHPEMSATELLEYSQLGPTAILEGQKSRAPKIGELDDTQKKRIEYHDKNYADTVRKAEEQNAGTLREMQEQWSPNLKSGTKYSQFMLDAAKSWAKATGQKEIPQNLQQTEQFFNYQKNDILSGLKQTGSNPTDADRDYAAAAAGDISNSPKTIRNLLYLKEKQNNLRIAQHNAEVEQSGSKVSEKAMRGKFQSPNKIMREVAEEHHPGYIAMLVREGKENDPKAKAYFENDRAKGVGPGVYDHLVAEEKARQKKD